MKTWQIKKYKNHDQVPLKLSSPLHQSTFNTMTRYFTYGSQSSCGAQRKPTMRWIRNSGSFHCPLRSSAMPWASGWWKSRERKKEKRLNNLRADLRIQTRRSTCHFHPQLISQNWSLAHLYRRKLGNSVFFCFQEEMKWFDKHRALSVPHGCPIVLGPLQRSCEIH